jgi:hypothetical protein
LKLIRYPASSTASDLLLLLLLLLSLLAYSLGGRVALGLALLGLLALALAACDELGGALASRSLRQSERAHAGSVVQIDDIYISSRHDAKGTTESITTSVCD